MQGSTERVRVCRERGRRRGAACGVGRRMHRETGGRRQETATRRRGGRPVVPFLAYRFAA